MSILKGTHNELSDSGRLEHLQSPKDRTSNCGISSTLCQAPGEERWQSQQFVCLAPLELLCKGKCFLHLSVVEAQYKESREKTKPKLRGANGHRLKGE